MCVRDRDADIYVCVREGERERRVLALSAYFINNLPLPRTSGSNKHDCWLLTFGFSGIPLASSLAAAPCSLLLLQLYLPYPGR